MKWQLYRVVYQLKSNLHIGWRKIGNLMQTRHYIPSRTWHGATTSLLAQHLGTRDYRDIGDFVHKHLIFSYFFFATDKANPLLPHWEKGHMTYGLQTEKTISSSEFEYQFIKSQESTSIDTQSNTSLEGQLYEIEYIAPFVQEQEAVKPVFIVGYLFARAHGRDDEVFIQGKDLFSQVLQHVQLGGERTYGFGMLEFHECCQCNDMFGYSNIALEGKQPTLTVDVQKPLLAHVLATDSLGIQGQLEPFVGRKWRTHPGQHVAYNGVCFAPGATLTSTPATFKIGSFGIWEPLMLPC